MVRRRYRVPGIVLPASWLFGIVHAWQAGRSAAA